MLRCNTYDKAFWNVSSVEYKEATGFISSKWRTFLKSPEFFAPSTLELL